MHAGHLDDILNLSAALPLAPLQIGTTLPGDLMLVSVRCPRHWLRRIGEVCLQANFSLVILHILGGCLGSLLRRAGCCDSLVARFSEIWLAVQIDVMMARCYAETCVLGALTAL